MLHIVKQFMFGLTGMLKLEFGETDTMYISNESDNSTGSISPEIKNLDEAKDIKQSTQSALEDLYNDINKDNLGYIKNYIEAIQFDLKIGDKGADVGKLQYALLSLGYNIGTGGEFNNGADKIYGSKVKIAIQDLQNKFGLPVTGNFNNETKTKLLKVINAEILERESEKVKKEQDVEAKQDSYISIGENQENYKTQEKGVSGSNEKFAGIDLGKLTKDEVLKEVHQGSLNNLLQNHSAEQLEGLVNNLKKALGEGGEDIAHYTYTNILGFRNYSDAIKVLEDAGYKVKGGYLGTVEALGVIGTINGVYETQKVLSETTDFREKLKIIFDYNADGLLDSKNRFYTQEIAIFDAVKTESDFNNLISNLTGQTGEEFLEKFNKNYFTAREIFKEALATRMEADYVLDPALMISDPKAQEKFNKLRVKISTEVVNSIDVNKTEQRLKEQFYTDLDTELQKISDLEKREKLKESLIKQYGEVASELMKKVQTEAESAYLQSISGVVHGNTGVAATFNIQEFTDKLIDTASIGLMNGVLGFQLGKAIFKNESSEVAVGLVSFYPYIGGTHEIYSEEMGNINTFSQTHVENGYDYTVGGALSKVGVIGIDRTIVDETTQEGIKKMTQQMRELITKTLQNIIDGKKFQDLGLDENPQNIHEYNRVKALYLAGGGNNQANIEAIISGTVNNYERKLYRDARGLEVTGVSLALIGGNLPVLGIHGEYHTQEWSERKQGVIRGFNNELIVETKTKNLEGIDDKKAEEIYEKLSKEFKNAFSSKTRYNEGANDFLTPSNNIDIRWRGLLKMSKISGSLRNAKLSDYLDTITNTTEKTIIISTLSQWTRQGRQVSEIIDSNKNDSEKINKLIELDRGRRSKFESQFGFSTTNYNKIFNEKLIEGGVINSIIQSGIAFDSVSTLHVEGNKKVTGIDLFQANLSMLADKEKNPITVEIKKSDYKAFISTIEQQLGKNNSEIISTIIKGLNNDTLSLYFYKDPEGYDDRIVIMKDGKTVSTQEIITSSEFVGVNKAFNNTDYYNLYGVDNKNDSSTDKTSTQTGVNNGDGGSGIGTDTGGFNPNNPETPAMSKVGGETQLGSEAFNLPKQQGKEKNNL